jgi:hypothetical protein
VLSSSPEESSSNGLTKHSRYTDPSPSLFGLIYIQKLSVTKIEQLGSGAVYCQILDAIHPGKVNMSKVNWKAHLEWEFINNLKILQQSFLKCGLNKHIEVLFTHIIIIYNFSRSKDLPRQNTKIT